MATGITKRHSSGCRSREGGRCNCDAGWEASVFSKRDGKKIRKTFAREAEAKSWRADALAALARGGLRAPKPTTIRRPGRRGRGRRRRGPSATARATRSSHRRCAPTAARCAAGPARFRLRPPCRSARAPTCRSSPTACSPGAAAVDDSDDAAAAAGDLPPRASTGARSRSTPAPGCSCQPSGAGASAIASPAEAEALIAAVPERDRAIWATAMYAGLRLGELRALRVDDVDLASGVIRVERGWDPNEGVIELKTHAGRRKVPIAAVLRDHLAEHLARDRADRRAS